jgi:hypothetical protein
MWMFYYFVYLQNPPLLIPSRNSILRVMAEKVGQRLTEALDHHPN